MKIELFNQPIKLYRGVTSKNLPVRYPGLYYTQDKELAKWYAKDGGKVHSISFIPEKIFSIDQLLSDESFKNDIINKFEQFVSKTSIDIEDTQLYDNLFNNITDFSYPTTTDNEFLRSLGYDSVYFSHEGGQRVDSWYIF